MFIFRRKGGITAKKLAIELNCRTSKINIPSFREFIVNYGGKFTGANLNANCEFDKYKASKIMQNNEISTPKTFLRGERIPNDMFPLLARKRFHSQGRDVIFVRNQEELNRLNRDYDYLIQYIDKTSEYRVHILGDYDTIVSVKIPKVETANKVVRSKRNGWIQVSYDREYKHSLIDLAKRAVKTLNLNFGAVDIIRKDNKLYVLEINCAPGLEDRKLKKYAEYFKYEENRIQTRNNIAYSSRRRSR